MGPVEGDAEGATAGGVVESVVRSRATTVTERWSTVSDTANMEGGDPWTEDNTFGALNIRTTGDLVMVSHGGEMDPTMLHLSPTGIQQGRCICITFSLIDVRLRKSKRRHIDQLFSEWTRGGSS